MVALITKYSPGNLDDIIIALSVTAPVIVFFNLQLRLLQALDSQNDHRFRDFITLRLIAQCFSLGLLAIWAFAFNSDLALAVCLMVIAASRAFYSIGETFYGEQQKFECMGGIASSMAMKGVLSLTCFSYFLIVKSDLYSALAAWAVIHFITLAFDVKQTLALGIRAKELLPTSTLKSMGKLAKKGFPLGVSGLLISLQINIPNYALMSSEYKDEIGIFGALLFLTTVGRKIIESGVRATGPRLSNILVEGRMQRFRQLRLRLCMLSASLGIAGLLAALFWGESLLAILYTNAFVPYLPVLLWVIGGETLNFASLALEHALSAGKKFDAQLRSIISSVLALVAASWCLIPNYGVLGAAWAVALGGAARLLATIILTRNFDVKK